MDTPVGTVQANHAFVRKTPFLGQIRRRTRHGWRLHAWRIFSLLMMPAGRLARSALPAVALWTLIGTTVSAAQEGLTSGPYLLANRDVLSLVTHEFWNGESTELSVDLVLTKAADGTRERILRQPVVHWGDDLRTVPHDGVFPTIKSVVEEGGRIAILYSTMVGLTPDGQYLLLERAGDIFRKAGELQLGWLFPTHFTIKWEEPLEAKLHGLHEIHMVHHDRFTVDIRIASDNSVTINGKPCAPGNAPIKRMNYRPFLHALSPTTAQSYDGKREDPGPILWWGNAAPSPPFNWPDYKQMSKSIDWMTPQTIDVATVPEEWKAAISAHNSSVSSQAPNVSSVSSASSAGNGNIPKASPPTPLETHRSTPWLVWAAAGIPVIGLLWLFLRKRR